MKTACLWLKRRTGTILVTVADGATQGSEIRAESDEARAYFAPHFNLGSGRMVAHGTATTEGHVGDLGGGYLFAPPDARGVVRLPDRALAVHGVHGFFPALTPGGDVISTILHLAGEPFPLGRCAPDGSELATLFESEAGIPWGVAVAREARWLVVAIGPLFAPGEAEVDVWRMGLDGTDATNLTADLPGNHALPHVSANGGRIVFRTGGDGGGPGLRDGSRRRGPAAAHRGGRHRDHARPHVRR